MKLKSIVLSIALLQSLGGVEALAQTSATWTVTGSWGATDYARAGDFDGDGRTDIVSPYGADGRMKINNGSGFTSESWVIDGGSTTWPSYAPDLLVGDFDCNGTDDLVRARVDTGTISIKFSNASNNTFTTSAWTIQHIHGSVIQHFEPLWGPQDWVRVGDFDGDGCRDDIVSFGVQSDSSHAHVFVGQRAPFGSGTSEFWFAEGRDEMNTTAGTPPWTVVGDFDNDGHDDIVSANGGNAYMSFGGSLYCLGACPLYYFSFDVANWTVSGSWGATNYAKGSQPSSGASSIYSPTGTSIYKKTPSGGAFSSTTLTVNGSWGSAAWTFIGDFDGDGSEDDYASANGSNVYMKFL